MIKIDDLKKLKDMLFVLSTEDDYQQFDECMYIDEVIEFIDEYIDFLGND